MTYEIPPNAVAVIRQWGSRYQSNRHNAKRHVGMTCLALELDYGGGEARKAERALGKALSAGRVKDDIMHNIAFLMHQTSDSAWGLLKAAMPPDEWGSICGAVSQLREEARRAERTFVHPLPERRRGRPTDALRAH